MAPLLEIRDLWAGYDGGDVLQGVSLTIDDGSVTALLGRNGIGKTTLLRAIVGLISPSAGEVSFDGEDVTDCQPHETYRRGIGLVPERRGIFPELTVEENLRVPTVDGGGRDIPALYERFPALETVQDSKGKHLSGGEQQLLAIARALRPDPQLFLLDEPSEGLAPQIVADVASAIESIAGADTTVLLVEQNVRFALDVATHVTVMDDDGVVLDSPVEQLQTDSLDQYLGVNSQS